jgi:hypothetical protein
MRAMRMMRRSRPTLLQGRPRPILGSFSTILRMILGCSGHSCPFQPGRLGWRSVKADSLQAQMLERAWLLFLARMTRRGTVAFRGLRIWWHPQRGDLQLFSSGTAEPGLASRSALTTSLHLPSLHCPGPRQAKLREVTDVVGGVGRVSLCRSLWHCDFQTDGALWDDSRFEGEPLSLPASPLFDRARPGVRVAERLETRDWSVEPRVDGASRGDPGCRADVAAGFRI